MMAGRMSEQAGSERMDPARGRTGAPGVGRFPAEGERRRRRGGVSPYEDLLSLPHPVSKAHPPMPREDRAAQFAPFAALSGHGAAIRETARLTEDWAEPDEDAKAELDRRLGLLECGLAEGVCPEIAVTYFQPDARKEGGAYHTLSARLHRIDPYRKELVLEDGRRVPVGRIVEMEIRGRV